MKRYLKQFPFDICEHTKYQLIKEQWKQSYFDSFFGLLGQKLGYLLSVHEGSTTVTVGQSGAGKRFRFEVTGRASVSPPLVFLIQAGQSSVLRYSEDDHYRKLHSRSKIIHSFSNFSFS